jgi:ribosomal protein L11 methyltransferase
MSSWKLSAHVSQGTAKAALEAQESELDWDAEIVVSACEIAPDKPDEWAFEAWLHREPEPSDIAAIESLFEGSAPSFTSEKLPETDWVVESQKGVPPIREGRFYVHTPDHAPAQGAVNFVIPASLAFGTGQHETTAGCLGMLDAIQTGTHTVHNHADIGTGTGLLAFAAMELWPKAMAIASDVDPVCVNVVTENARLNSVAIGDGENALTMVIADGMEHPALLERAPFDLLIANILAGPLIDLAPSFAKALASNGHIVLAGLLESQEKDVRAAYSEHGFRLERRDVRGDWSILWLRKQS